MSHIVYFGPPDGGVPTSILVSDVASPNAPTGEGFLVALANVWQQSSYNNDTAAAAGGVQVGFPYRNGNLLMVRVV
jgi:hypothetical protein